MDPRHARLMGVHLFEPEPRWYLPSQRHTFHELLVLHAGAMKLDIGGREVAAGSGDALFYQAGHLHTETNDRRRPVRFIYMSFEWPVKGTLLAKVRDTQGRMRQLVQWLLHDSNSQAPGAGRVRSTLFQALLAEWLRLQVHREDPLLQKVRTHVRDHIARNISLDELAQLCGMSKFHFARLFKKRTTRTPMDEVRALRIEHAKQLIGSTDLPLKAIAPRCGLGDQYHMTRLFRRYLNATPGELRKSKKGR